jgi:hypothetical protein
MKFVIIGLIVLYMGFNFGRFYEVRKILKDLRRNKCGSFSVYSEFVGGSSKKV